MRSNDKNNVIFLGMFLLIIAFFLTGFNVPKFGGAAVYYNPQYAGDNRADYYYCESVRNRCTYITIDAGNEEWLVTFTTQQGTSTGYSSLAQERRYSTISYSTKSLLIDFLQRDQNAVFISTTPVQDFVDTLSCASVSGCPEENDMVIQPPIVQPDNVKSPVTVQENDNSLLIMAGVVVALIMALMLTRRK
jgi:hypothetical protein